MRSILGKTCHYAWGLGVGYWVAEDKVSSAGGKGVHKARSKSYIMALSHNYFIPNKSQLNRYGTRFIGCGTIATSNVTRTANENSTLSNARNGVHLLETTIQGKEPSEGKNGESEN